MFQEFQLFAADSAAAPGPDDQPSALGKVKVWIREGAEVTKPALEKAASLTLAGAKKASAAGASVTKRVASGVRDEVSKRRGDAAGRDEGGAEVAAADEGTEK